MYSVDPKVYDTHKKSEKKSGGDTKKLKPVRKLNEILKSTWGEMLLKSLRSRLSLTFAHHCETVFSNGIFSFHNTMQWH